MVLPWANFCVEFTIISRVVFRTTTTIIIIIVSSSYSSHAGRGARRGLWRFSLGDDNAIGTRALSCAGSGDGACVAARQ